MSSWVNQLIWERWTDTRQSCAQQPRESVTNYWQSALQNFASEPAYGYLQLADDSRVIAGRTVTVQG